MIQQSTRIVAQIDDKPFELRTDLLSELFDGLFQAGMGLFIELGNAEIGDIVLGIRANRVNSNNVTSNRYVKRVILALADDGQDDCRMHRPAHLLNCLLECQTGNLDSVEMGNEIT